MGVFSNSGTKNQTDFVLRLLDHKPITVNYELLDILTEGITSIRLPGYLTKALLSQKGRNKSLTSVGVPTVSFLILERGDDMPLFKGSGCKSTPGKVLNYIIDSRKVTLISSLNLDDNRSYSSQFRETARLFDKGSRFDERKYYHFKLSCDQADNVPAAVHHQYAEALASTLFPNHECVIATHTDTATVHSYIVVNSVSFADGRKLDIRNAQYAKMKDFANELGHQMGFSTLDFRKPAKDRITSPERHIELNGGTSWKQELREVITLAKSETHSIQDFEAYLLDYGVTLTRNTDRTIAYKHPKKTKLSAAIGLVWNIRKDYHS